VDETLVFDHSSEAIEKCFHVVLFIVLYKVVLSFKYVVEILVCDIQIKVTEQFLLVALLN